MGIAPRPEQIAARERLAAEVARIRKEVPGDAPRIIVSMPTGAGKTYLSAFMILNALRKGLQSIFVVDRLVLVRQTVKTLNSLGIPLDIMQGGSDWSGDAKVIVASAQTMIRRSPPNASLVFVDECHTMMDGISKYIQSLPERSVVIGLSATPFKRELREYWHSILSVATTDGLIENGTLTPLDPHTSVPLIDMKGVEGKGAGGEWSGSQAEHAAMGIIGDIPKIWREETRRKFGERPVKTLCFVPTVAYAEWLSGKFREGGIKSDSVSYKDAQSPGARERSLDLFASGETEVMITVEALVKGFDQPDVECVVDARPRKKSLEGFAQALGRGMRCSPGKKDCMLLDFAGNWPRFSEEYGTFCKYGIKYFGQYTAPPRPSRKDGKPGKPDHKQCPNCKSWLSRSITEKCPVCGQKLESEMSDWEWVDGKMVSMDGATGKLNEMDLWPHLCAHCAMHYFKKLDPERIEDEAEAVRKKAVKWALVLHKEITGSWPKPYGRGFEEPKGGAPHPAVSRKIRERNRTQYARSLYASRFKRKEADSPYKRMWR